MRIDAGDYTGFHRPVGDPGAFANRSVPAQVHALKSGENTVTENTEDLRESKRRMKSTSLPVSVLLGALCGLV
jgi:hypothetical protein